jgi:undecaprenyl-diphosphatase
VSVVEAVVLGAVQGLTEFIPISSSGHLVVVPELLEWDQPGLAFDVLLHVASYWR